MNLQSTKAIPRFLEILGLDEEPMGILYGENKAVLGGWDPSARKFFKTDELTFTVPYEMFCQMLGRFEQSFLTTRTWTTVQKKIARSKRTWGESERPREL